MLDVSVAYNRYKFVGHEFLTWLWFMIETDPDALKKADPDLSAMEIGNKMILENSRNNADETISISGDGAGLEEALLALKKGAKVTEINLVMRAGELEWRFSLKGESLGISGLKCPQTGKVESKSDIEGAVLEKLYLCGRVIDMVEKAFCMFVKLRVSPQWETGSVRKIGSWIDASIK
ncbi:MAG: hypothetical protein GXP53_04775 [Deltaproteobacteria bacterium]|nr:hypothetical protein [Deltaproteobacteria bacterium]